MNIITDIADVSHWETGGDVAAAAAQGLVMLWAKTGQGVGSPDESYGPFRDAAKAAGILFGSYHVLTDVHPGEDQADDMLSRCDPHGLLAADVEKIMQRDSDGVLRDHSPKLVHVEPFMARVFERTGRWPVFYSFTNFIQNLRIPSTSIIGHCPLWQAQYSDPVVRPGAACWSKIDLWQYTDCADGPRDEVTYPRHTPGFGKLCDRNAFYGTLDELRVWCASCGMPQIVSV